VGSGDEISNESSRLIFLAKEEDVSFRFKKLQHQLFA